MRLQEELSKSRLRLLETLNTIRDMKTEEPKEVKIVSFKNKKIVVIQPFIDDCISIRMNTNSGDGVFLSMKGDLSYLVKALYIYLNIIDADALKEYGNSYVTINIQDQSRVSQISLYKEINDNILMVFNFLNTPSTYTIEGSSSDMAELIKSLLTILDTKLVSNTIYLPSSKL